MHIMELFKDLIMRLENGFSIVIIKQKNKISNIMQNERVMAKFQVSNRALREGRKTVKIKQTI